MPVVDGTYYHDWTVLRVIELLEALRVKGERIRLHYGDRATGEDWLETHEVTGYVSRSTGDKPIPILVYNSRAMGGSPIMSECIVKIRTTTWQELWRHPNYHLPVEKSQELIDAMGRPQFIKQFGDPDCEAMELRAVLLDMKDRQPNSKEPNGV